MKRFRHWQSGFTLLELLILIGLLAILAAVIIPNVVSFKKTGDLAAANTEVQNVRTAATGYRAHNDTWPVNSDNLTPYISGNLAGFYLFDIATGRITNGAGWVGLAFNIPRQLWEKAP